MCGHVLQLSTMLMAVSKGDTVLTLAASSESKDAFEAVVDACGKRLTDEQVRCEQAFPLNCVVVIGESSLKGEAYEHILFLLMFALLS